MEPSEMDFPSGTALKVRPVANQSPDRRRRTLSQARLLIFSATAKLERDPFSPIRPAPVSYRPYQHRPSPFQRRYVSVTRISDFNIILQIESNEF
jgi:hypothetical protein